MEKIVIIGNGISGITAARHIRKKSDKEIVVISSETGYMFSRTALMYIYMGDMKFEHTKPYEDYFWKKNRIELLFAHVGGIDTANKKVLLTNSSSLGFDKLIIATGSLPNKFGWPGQDLKGVQGLYHIQDVESMEVYTKDIERAVIVGGGLIGIEMAEMLLSRNIKVTMLVREASFWNNVLPEEESQLINRHIREHNIDLRLSTELKEIVGDGKGRVKAVITSKGDIIECGFTGLTVGVRPNISFLKDSGIPTEKGVLVNEYLETGIQGIFAIGDCAQHLHPPASRKPVEQVWYTGKMMGETVAETITGNPKKYEPGVWFNSAKFLDIEYQTYGWVFNKQRKNEETLYWEHKDGKKALRFVYDKDDKSLLGINVFGIRMRHEVCQDWIIYKEKLSCVIEHLQDANFDPEFYKKYEKEIFNYFSLQLMSCH